MEVRERKKIYVSHSKRDERQTKAREDEVKKEREMNIFEWENFRKTVKTQSSGSIIVSFAWSKQVKKKENKLISEGNQKEKTIDKFLINNCKIKQK